MTAMEAATKNAKEMIDVLTIQYNKARQERITKELLDIVGGAEALAVSRSVAEASKGAEHEPGQDRPGHRAGRGRGVRAGPAARHLQRARGARARATPTSSRTPPKLVARGGPAPGREPGAHGRHGRDRRAHARHARERHRRARSRSRSGKETLGRIINIIGEPVDKGPASRRPRPTRSTGRRRPSRSSRPRSRCSRPASRSSTCSSPTPRAARPASSAAPASARPCSSRS